MLAPLLGLDAEQFLTTDQVLYVRGLDNATSLVDSGRGGQRLPAARADRRAGAGAWPPADA